MIHRQRIRLFAPVFYFSLILLLWTGCASYVERMEPVKIHMRQGDFDAALIELDKRFGEKDDDLVLLMERGLLLRYAERYEESNLVFEQAEQLADDLYTKSISRTLSALITSDRSLAYEGEDFERVIINYYRAMNYLDLDKPDDALVECRKVIRKLDYYQEQYEGDDPKKYVTDPFILYLTGLIYESTGEINDAYISFKKAVAAFEDESLLSAPPPPSLHGDLITAGRILGFSDEVEFFQKKYGSENPREEIPPDHGEIILLIETGFVPMKIEHSISLPILEDEEDEEIEDLSVKLRKRSRYHREYTDVHYWLKVALPGYPPYEPPFWVSVTAGERDAHIVEDFDILARASLDDRMPNILLRAIVRALVKYFATTKGEDAVEKEHGEVAGKIIGGLLNVAAAATENADLRAWLGLPRVIRMVRFVRPSGMAAIPIVFRSRDGYTTTTEISVEVFPGRTRFVAHRVF